MRLDGENCKMQSKRVDRCYACGRYWNPGDTIYFRIGHPFYFCTETCRENSLGITNNTGIPRERNATERMPVQEQQKQQQEHHIISREERILKMHDEKMLLLGEIVAAVKALTAAEEKRNEYLKKEADR